MYNYETEKSKLLTDEGQQDFVKIRDSALKLLEQSGAFKMFAPFKGIETHLCDSWSMMAIIDRMVELGDIREITNGNVAGQDRVFVAIKKTA